LHITFKHMMAWAASQLVTQSTRQNLSCKQNFFKKKKIMSC